MVIRVEVETISPDEPHYTISDAARLVDLHPQTLRYYEAVGLVVPRRSRGNVRRYSPRDIERLRKIRRLTREMGVNLAGVAIILRLIEQVTELQAELRWLESAVGSASTHER